MDSDEENYTDEQIQINILDDFIYNELDNVLDLYYDVINRFPYFLTCKSHHFTHFIMDTCVLKTLPEIKQCVDENFVINNEKEIDTTLWIVNNFLGKKRLPLIPNKYWTGFCYLHR